MTHKHKKYAEFVVNVTTFQKASAVPSFPSQIRFFANLSLKQFKMKLLFNEGVLFMGRQQQ